MSNGSPKPLPKDYVRVLRIVEYAGERAWVEETVRRAIHGTRATGRGSITAVTLHEYPEKLVEAEQTDDSGGLQP